MNIQRDTVRMPKATRRSTLPAFALAALIAMSGCMDEAMGPTPQPQDPVDQPTTLGLVEVTITGLGSDGGTSTNALSAADAYSLAKLKARRGGTGYSNALTPPESIGGGGDGTIELEPVGSGSFTEGERGAGGVRYVWASYRVRNAQEDGSPYDTPRQNLTFMAVSTPATIGLSAISTLDLFSGTPASASIAAQMLPTGQVHRDTDGDLASTGPDVIQIFTESEAGAVVAPAGVDDVFPYGFVVRQAGSSSSRALAASPATDQFDGIVTFAFRIPLQATPADDPFTVSIMMVAMDDSETKITQSPEEQGAAGQAAFEARATALGTTQVRLFPSGAYGGGIAQLELCGVRVAGPLGNPDAVLGGTCNGAVGIVHVNAAAAPGGDGTTWATAFDDLQDGLSLAQPGDEIWVAAGTYSPGTARGATFLLRNDVAVYGGFTGTETDRSARNPDPGANGTLLSGDVNGDDLSGGTNDENNYHVVTASGVAPTAILDGFTIRAGNATSATFSTSRGAGIFNVGGSPTLVNLRLTANAANLGGGIYNASGAAPALTDVVFGGNAAQYGGGMANEDGSAPILTTVSFTGNTAGVYGGGLYSNASNAMLTDVTFTANSALHGGGMADLDGATSSLRNVTFIDNTAVSAGGGFVNEGGGNGTLVNVDFISNEADYGGGLAARNASSKVANAMFMGNTGRLGGGGVSASNSEPVFVNVVFSGNVAGGTSPGYGGGLYFESGTNASLVNVTIANNTSTAPGGGIYNHGTMTLANTILWGNSASPGFAHQIWNDGGTATVSYSNIQDAFPGGVWSASLGTNGGNNQAQNPLFLDADGADNTMGTIDDDLRINQALLIDVGNNALPNDELDIDDDGNTAETIPWDVAGNARIVNAVVDIGAYERQ